MATSGFSMKAAIMLILVSVFLLVGCGQDRNSGETHPAGKDNRREFVAYQQPTRVIVTSDDASLPDGCHPRQVADLLITFVYAFNAGDQAVLSRTFFLSEGPASPGLLG